MFLKIVEFYVVLISIIINVNYKKKDTDYNV